MKAAALTAENYVKLGYHDAKLQARQSLADAEAEAAETAGVSLAAVAPREAGGGKKGGMGAAVFAAKMKRRRKPPRRKK